MRRTGPSGPVAAHLALVLWLSSAGHAAAEPQVTPETAALCAGSLEVWAEALDIGEPAPGGPEQAARVRRVHALYRAAAAELGRRTPGAGLADLVDQAYLEALQVWTNRREDGRGRRADGSPTAKARNARAAQADLMRFLDWCLDRSDSFADRFLGG